MLGKFSRKIFKISDYRRKIYDNCAFYFHFHIYLACHHIFASEIIVITSIKNPQLFIQKNQFLTSRNPSRHNHIFLIFCTQLVLGISQKIANLKSCLRFLKIFIVFQAFLVF